MYELIQVGERTYYIDCPAKMGLFRVNDREVYLIDSGNDKEAGKKVHKLLNAQGWSLTAILNTHSNADHIGGNRLLQERTGCKIYAPGLECAFTRYPELEPSFLYGGYPCKALRNKFLLAPASGAQELTPQALPAGLECFPLKGHFFDMVGFRTADDVCFLADCLTGEEVLDKYHISFLYDARAYLETLSRVEQLSARCFVPAHAQATEDIRPLVRRNREKLQEVLTLLTTLCETPRGFEELLQQVFATYRLTMDWNQYVLVGSTIRSQLAYLCDEGRVAPAFAGNRLLWQAV